MRGMAGSQRDGPHSWANVRSVSDDAALPIDRVLRLAMDDDLDAGVDPQWDPCAQAAVRRAEVPACGGVTEVACEVPSNLRIADGVVTTAAVVVVVVACRVLV